MGSRVHVDPHPRDLDRAPQQRYFRLKELIEDKEKVVAAISRHYAGERHRGLVVVFDNVDKRSRDVQLAIFEAAQWFKGLTRALVIVNLRDTTFEAHRDEPPLDAFINAVNFYIRSPRFAAMIRKRLEIVLDYIRQDPELSKTQKFTLESGAQVTYDSGRRQGFCLLWPTSSVIGCEVSATRDVEAGLMHRSKRHLVLGSDR